MKRCPSCSSSKRTRRSRKALLKYIPFSKAYACMDCGVKYLFIQPFGITIKIKTEAYRKLT
jgi:DNA-directed RNA polymerase subunit RPC12/RpoP